MDPLSAGLGLASAGLGFISGIGQQRTAASIAQAQLAAQNAAFLKALRKGVILTSCLMLEVVGILLLDAKRLVKNS